jgi:hypothetical protein
MKESVALSCAICETRKEKRFCPAVHGRICPQCCGTEREVTLDCPSECVYLQQARRHEPPRSLDDLDPSPLFPEVAVPEQFIYEREPLLGGLSFTIAKFARENREFHDRDVLAALTAIAQSQQTLVSSGLIYEAAPTAGPQQALAGEIQKMIAGFREMEQKHLGYSTLKESEALQAIVFLLRLAATRTSGRPRSRAFLDFLFEQFPQKDSLIAAPEDTASRIIMP